MAAPFTGDVTIDYQQPQETEGGGFATGPGRWEMPETDWFDQQEPPDDPGAPPPPPSFTMPDLPWENYGRPPQPFGEQYSVLGRPEWLSGPFEVPGRPAAIATPYVAPEWRETFSAPTMEEVTRDPGYQSRLSTGLQARERAAAAKGSILSGGHQKALEKFGQEFAANEYAPAFARAFDTYQQRYGQFADSANRGFQARQLNESAYQTDLGAAMGARSINENAYAGDAMRNLNQFQTRYGAYQDHLSNTRQAEEDWYRRFVENPTNWGLEATRAGAPR